MEKNIKELIKQMTLEEKAGLCSGLDTWRTKGVERLDIPSIMMTDGPHGLRKQDKESDNLGINESVPATCFPSGAGLASSWDRELLKKVGKTIGEEAQAENVSIVLGPAANIKRSPLCGRNFEYYSEDPYLSTEMAASYIKGVQSQGVGTSLKHFAANNQEHMRMSVDTIVDERTLREIYLASFEGAVKKAQPWTVMCAYNKLNGTFCSENRYLLNDVLRKNWGFHGFVISDWGAVNERAEGLFAGLELEMPSSCGINDKKIVDAVKNGSLKENVLDAAVERILKVVFKAVENKKENAVYSKEEHHKIARETARECMVLLKNEDSILPLKKKGNIAVIGAFAKNPRYQGGGSSHINPTKLDNTFNELVKSAGEDVKLTYAEGYDLESDVIDEELIKKSQLIAEKADFAIVFAGLPDRYESEAYDRQHMCIPENQSALIEAVAEVQKNVIVVLSNGSPIEMPWEGKARGILEAYLGGQATGGAIADLLFGDANPCGKLAETFPVKLSHNPSYINFPGEGDKVQYKEGVFVGYRYYDKKNIKPLFPFGYGLSYTSFEYTDISVDKKEISDEDTVTVTVKIKNTGKVAGKEIVQLYVKDVESSVIRPIKELKGFEKIEIQSGEEKTVKFVLDKRAFAYYNTEISDWYVESGDFDILVGKSSEEILLKETIKVSSKNAIKKKYHRNSTFGEIMADYEAMEKCKQLKMKFTEGLEMDHMMQAMMKNMPIRGMISFTQGKFTEDDLNMLLSKLNEEK